MFATHTRGKMSLVVGGVAVLAMLVSACSSTSSSTAASVTATPAIPALYQFGTVLGLHTSLFAAGTKDYYSPDAVEVDSGHVFVDYQNTTAKDCSDTNTSTVVEYSMDGKMINKFSVPGHSDGMRADPSTHLLWVSSCEDGNAKFATIDPASGTVTPYTFPTAAHGGGFDDMFFLNGMTFIAASAPNLNAAGVNVFPAIYQMTLGSGVVNLKPVLMGNASATDVTTGANNATVTLNEVDPDSLTVDTKGNLVLVNQGGNEIVSIANPGTAQQKVSRLSTGTQLDDTVFPKGNGRMLLTDAGINATFWVDSNYWDPSFGYTTVPNDSTVISFFGKVDLGTGLVTPTIVGLIKPTGLLFVPSN